MTRGATLFSGGRGVEMLLKDDIDFIYSVEFDPQIAAVGAQLGGHTIVSDVRLVDYSTWGALDYLHASPVCKNFSAAKANGVETDDDMTTAAAVVRCLEATQPRVFTLENVGAYEGSASYRLIVSWLNNNGYMWHAQTLNAADYGVPQTRRRLIVRAVRDALLPTLPPPVKWVGWYAAIEDLIPTLPASQFAPWQLARLPDGIAETSVIESDVAGDRAIGIRAITSPMWTIKANVGHNQPRAFIVEGTEMRGEITPCLDCEPLFTVKASVYKGIPRAFLIGSQNAGQEYSDGLRYEESPAMTITARQQPRALLVHANDMRSMPTRDEGEPAFTIAAGSHNSHAPDTKPKAWLSQGRVVKMTPRALARFQSIPDWYQLPDKSSLACTIIGNSVAPLMMRQIVRPLL